MTEPRMRSRHKGQQFDTKELEAYLTAYGDDFRPLPETVKCLDEIITDFIIETCHVAALSASYSHRAKIKVDDFKFALRKDSAKLGRVTELLNKDKELKKSRKLFDDDVEREGAREGKRQKKDHDEDTATNSSRHTPSSAASSSACPSSRELDHDSPQPSTSSRYHDSANGTGYPDLLRVALSNGSKMPKPAEDS